MLAQIENLKSHPSVHSRVISGEVEIRGWVYDIGDGSIWAADPESGRFEKIGKELWSVDQLLLGHEDGHAVRAHQIALLGQ